MTSIPINYIEFTTPDLAVVKSFYQTCFGWEFTDYGPTYTAFKNSGVEGGFELLPSSQEHEPKKNTSHPLVVLYHFELEELQKTILKAGGTITVPTFTFPGGRRFHFSDPVGNELAIWSE